MQIYFLKGELPWGNNVILNGFNHKQNDSCLINCIFGVTIIKIMHGFRPLFGRHVLFKLAMFDVTGLFIRARDSG